MGQPRWVERIITCRIYRRKLRNLYSMLEQAKAEHNVYAQAVIDIQIQEITDFLKRKYKYVFERSTT